MLNMVNCVMYYGTDEVSFRNVALGVDVILGNVLKFQYTDYTNFYKKLLPLSHIR